MTLARDPEGYETDWIHEFVGFRGKRVLEIGAGSGRLTWRYADGVRWAVGIDVEPETLCFAPRECPPELRQAVAWSLAEAEHLPFPHETFDLAVLAWSLWCMEHEGMVHALDEIHQVLAPGGLLLDLRPISGETPLEVLRPGRPVELAGYYDEPADHPDDVAANNAIARAVRRGQFVREREGDFRFAYYWDNVDEMRAYVKERWTATRLPGPVSRKARRLMAGGDARLRARVKMIITRLRKIS